MNEDRQKTDTEANDPFDGWELETPVAMMIYNRAEHTSRVFERIADAEPPVLLVVADGPVEGNGDDRERCRKTRSVTESIDWDCTVYRDYADTNMGIKDRFQSGLDWVFNTVDKAIILEDDCLPNRSFFRFLEEMLEEYRDDKRVMDISGSNHLETWKADDQDYHFTRYGGIWGWGTWADRWELCRQDMEGWDDEQVKVIVNSYLDTQRQQAYLHHILDMTNSRKINTWDYQWGFTRAANWSLTVTPSKNLVSNIGFGGNATNTTTEDSDLASIPTHELEFPIEGRDLVGPDSEYDQRYFELSTSIWDRYEPLRRIKSLYNRIRR